MAAEPDFIAPATVEAAVAALASPDAVAVAGGTSIGLLVGQGLLAPSALVWLGQVPELRRIDVEADRVVLGAGVTLAEVAAHPTVRAELPALAAAAGAVGNVRVRAVATLGGALAHADPRQDVPPALVALGASAEVAGVAGRRWLPVEGLATGFLSTVLQPDELVTAVAVPRSAARNRYYRFTPGSVDDYPTVAAAVALQTAGDRVTAARVAVGGAGPTVYAVPAAAGLVHGPSWASPAAVATVAEVADAAAQLAEPVDDRLGSAAYKRRMVAVWVRRVLLDALAEPVAAEPVAPT